MIQFEVKRITGNVTDRYGQPLIGAKVFGSDASGKMDRDDNGNAIATLTDSNGNYDLIIPALLGIPKSAYVTAKVTMKPKQTKKLGASDKYDFVIGQSEAQAIPEVTASANIPNPTAPVVEPNDKKWKPWHWLLLGGGVLIATSVIVAVAGKKKTA